MRKIGLLVCVAVLHSLASIGLATAQTDNAGCSVSDVAGQTRTIRCPNGVTIVVENGARYELGATGRDGKINTVELNDKALLLEVPPRSGRKTFQVNTPQAIAAVRGTRWAVDVTEGKTSVLVVRGKVAVGRRAGARGATVTLGPGEGVDVEGQTPLVVKKWAPARVAALMARLGQ
jgi:ferric-dicitrate binding protein FerR (iron transport regulator)